MLILKVDFLLVLLLLFVISSIINLQLTFCCLSSWAIFFSHPKDYTPVCTTELGRVVNLQEEFKKRGVKTIALSCDNVDDHKGWSKVTNDFWVKIRVVK